MAVEGQSGDVPEWISGRRGRLLLFRVNRRQLEQPSIFAHEDWSFDQHVDESLLLGEEVVTGRGNQRLWALGDRSQQSMDDQRVLVGRVGYIRQDERTTAEFDPDREHWMERIEEQQTGVFAPFFLMLDQELRLLAVLRHRTFLPQTLAKVFTDLLNRGEARLGSTVEWEVEPIGSPEAFYNWLARTDVVTRISLVVKQSNPDAIEGFEYVNQRLKRLQAGRERRELRAAGETGLSNVTEDREVQGAVEAQHQGWGYVTGQGYAAEGSTSYDGRERLDQVSLPRAPETWGDLLAAGLEALAQYVRNRRTRADHDQIT